MGKTIKNNKKQEKRRLKVAQPQFFDKNLDISKNLISNVYVPQMVICVQQIMKDIDFWKKIVYLPKSYNANDREVI